MSWAHDEWKDGLPMKALQKIEVMESELDRSKRDKQQKQCQIDSLQAMLNKQKQIAESEKALSVSSRRENQTLAENCENLERARRKAMQELSQKDARYAAVEDQLKRTKTMLEAESNQKSQMKIEMERQASKLLSAEKSFQDLQLQCHKLGSVEQKFNELQSQHQQLVACSCKTENQLRKQLDLQEKEKKRAEYQADEANRKLEGVMKSNRALETSVKELKVKVSSFDKERQDFMKTGETTKSQCASKDRTINELQTQQGQGQSLLKQKNDELSALLADKDKLANENEKLAVEVETMKLQLADSLKSRHELEKLAVEVETMKLQLADSLKSRRELEEVNGALQKDVACKGQEALQMIERVEVLEMQLLDMKVENESLKKKTDESTRAVKDTTDRCNFSMSSASHVTKDNNDASSCAATADLMDLTSDLNKYQMQINQLSTEKCNLSLAVDNLTETVRQLRKELIDKERKYKVNCESAEIDLEYLNSQVEDLQKQLSEVSTQRDIANNLVTQKSEAVSRLTNEVKETKQGLTQLENLESQLTKCQLTVRHLTEANCQLESAVDASKCHVTRLEHEVCESQSARNVMCERIEDFEKQTTEMTQQLGDMRGRLVMADQAVEKHREVASKAGSQLLILRQELDSNQDTTLTLTSKITEQQAEITSLQSTLTDLQRHVQEEQTRMTREMQSQCDVITSLHAQVKSLQETCTLHEIKAREKEGSFSELKVKLEAAAEAADKEIEELHHELDLAQVAKETAKNMTEEFEKQLRDEKCRVTNLEADSNRKQRQQELTIFELRENVWSLKQGMKGQEEAMEEAEKRLSTKIVDLETQLVEVQQVNENLRSQLQSVTVARQQLLEQKLQMEEEMCSLRDESERLKAGSATKSKAQSDAILELQERLGALQTAYSEREDMMKHAEKEVASFRHELEEQINNVSQKCQSLEIQLDASVSRCHILMRAKDDLEEQLKEVNEKMHEQEIQTEMERTEKETTLHDMRECEHKLHKKIEKLEKAGHDAEAKLIAMQSDFESQIEDMSYLLDEQQCHIDTQHTENMESVRNNEELAIKARELEQELANQESCWQQTASEKENEVTVLQQRLSEMMAHHEEETEVLKEKNEKLTLELVDIKRNSDELEHEVHTLQEMLESTVNEKKSLLEEQEKMDIKLSELNGSLLTTKAKMQQECEAAQLIQQEKQQMEEQLNKMETLLRQEEIESGQRRETGFLEIVSLQDNIATLKHQCAELEYAKSTAKEETEAIRAELMSQINATTNNIDSLHTQLDKAEEQVLQKQQEIEQLRQNVKELEEMREKDGDRQIMMNTLQEKVMLLEDTISDQNKTEQEMHQELRRVMEELESKLRENREKEMELRREMQRADEGDRKRDDLETSISELRKTIDDYMEKEKDWESGKRMIKELELQVIELGEKCEKSEIARQLEEGKVQELNNTMESQMRDMTHATNALCEKLEAAESQIIEINRLKAEINTLNQRMEEEILEHKKQRDNSNQCQDKQAKKVNELNGTIREAEELISFMKAEIDAQRSEASKQLAASDKEVLSYKQTISDLQDQLEKLQQSLKEQETSSQEITWMQPNLEAQLSLLSAESSSLQAELEAALSAKKKAETELQQLALKWRDEMAENKRKASMQEEAISKLEHQVKSLEDDLSQRETETKDLALARKELESQVSQLSGELSENCHNLKETQMALKLREDEAVRLNPCLSESTMQSNRKAESQEQEIVELKDRLSEVQQAYNELQVSMQANRVHELEDKIHKLSTEIRTLRDQAETNVFLEDEVLTKKEHMEETIAALEKQLVVMETERKKSDEKRLDAVDNNNLLQQERETLRVKLAKQEGESSAKMESLNNIIAEVKSQLGCLETVLQEKEGLLEQFESQRAEYQSDLRKKNEQEMIIMDLQEQLNCLQQMSREQEGKMQRADTEFASARSEFQQTVKQLSAERNEAVASLQHLRALRDTDRNMTESKLKELSLQYDELCACRVAKETAVQEAKELAEKLREALCTMDAEQVGRKEQERISGELREQIQVLEMVCSEQKSAMESAVNEHKSMKSILKVNVKKLTRDVEELTVQVKETTIAKNEAVEENMALQKTVEELKSNVNLLEMKLLTQQEKSGVDVSVNGSNKMPHKEFSVQNAKAQYTESTSSALVNPTQNSTGDPSTSAHFSVKRSTPTRTRTPLIESSIRKRYQLRSAKQADASKVFLPQRILPKNQKPQECNFLNTSEGEGGKGLLRTGETGARRKNVHWKDELAENSPLSLQLHTVKVITPDSPNATPLKQSNHSVSPTICHESPLLVSFSESTDEVTPGKSPGKRTLYSKARRDPSSLPSQAQAKRVKTANPSKLRPPKTKTPIIDVNKRPECKTQ